MGISKGSVWGNIKQSVGSAVGYRLKGQNVVRQKPLSYNDANTLQQQKNRTKQAILVVMYRNYRNMVQRMFSGMPATYSDYNSFVSLNHAAVTVEDDLTHSIDRSKIVLSKGNAQNISNVALNSFGSDMQIIWDTNYDGVNGFPGDIVNICGVESTSGVVQFINSGNVLRSSSTVLIPLNQFAFTDTVFITVKNVNNVPSDTLMVSYP